MNETPPSSRPKSKTLIEQLAASEHRLRSVLDATVDSIITMDTVGTVESFNRSAEAMFGYKAAEVIGHNLSMLMASPYREHHDTYLNHYAKTKEAHVIGSVRQFRARYQNGTEFPIQLSVSEIADLSLFTGVVHDLTKQRQLQEEIVRVATTEQPRIGQELHESALQELTGLGLLAQSLADALSEPAFARQQQLAARIAAGIAETNRQIRNLVEGLIPVPVDADGLMVALENLARRTEASHDVSIRFVCPRPVRIPDDGVALHMYRLAQEAVTNSIRHSSAETVSIYLQHENGTVQRALESGNSS